MKKRIITWGILILLSNFLMGQSPINALIEQFQNKRADLREHPFFLTDHLSELDQTWSYQLDSIVRGYYDPNAGKFTEIEEKEVFTYDENGLKQTATTFYYGEEGYYPVNRIIFEYDNAGLILKFGIQRWSEDSLKWEYFLKDEYFYDESGLLQEILFYQSQYSSGLELNAKYIITYDSLGQVQTSLYQSFQSEEWIDVSETQYAYDENGRKASYSFWALDKGDLPIETYRIEYLYDSIGQLIVDVEYETSSSGEELTPFKKDSFDYDEQNKLIWEIMSFYYGEAWNAELKKEYAYENSEIPSLINWYVAEDLDTWFLFYSEEILTDENDNILSYNSSAPLFYGNSWSPHAKIEFERSNEIALTDLSPGSIDWMTDEFYYDFDFRGFQEGNHAVLRYSFRVWNEFFQQWDYEHSHGESLFYFRDLMATSVEENAPSANFLVYPNPTDRLLTIETDLTNAPFDLYLYNLFGQRVFRKSISSNEQVVLPALPEGIYVLQLSKESQVYGTRRIIIRH